MGEFLAQAFGALLVAALAFYGFRGGLSVRVRGVLVVVLVLVWFLLSPSFLPLVASR